MRRCFFQTLSTLPTASALLSAALAAPPPSGTTTTVETIEVKPAVAKAAVVAPAVPAGVVVTKKKARVLPAGPVQKVIDAAKPAQVQMQIEMRAAQVAQNAQLQAQLVRQSTPQIRAILRAEYQLLLRACNPNKAQRREIARAGEKAVKDAADKVAIWQQTPRRVVFNNGGQVIETTDRPDPRKLIEDALAAAVKTQLSPEHAARYLHEVELRKIDQTRVDVRSLVAKLDQALLLSPDQREKIAETLSAKANEEWARSIPLFANNDTQFPQVPDKYLVPILSPAQSKAWQATLKPQGYYWNGFVSGMVADNAPLEDAELGEAADAAK